MQRKRMEGPSARMGARIVTNPNPKVRKSGAVAKAVRASLFFARWFLKLEG